MNAIALSIVLALATPVPQLAAEKPPPNAEALGESYYLFMRAQTLERQGDLPGAIAALRRAATLAPKAAEILAELAGLYAREGRATDSIREGEAALDIDPNNREAHRIIGLVQAAVAERLPQPTAMLTQAIAHLEKAQVADNRDPGIDLSLGRLYVRTEKHLPAIRTLRTFLLQQPGHPEGMLLLAQAFDGNGEPAEAMAVLEDAVKAAPEDNRIKAWLGEFYEKSGQWTKAAAIWEALSTATGGDTAYRTRAATAFVAAGELGRARTTLTALTASAPAEVMGWYLLSQVERRLSNLDAAEAAARKILALDAEDARGLLALAETLGARGDHAGVIRTLEARVAVPKPGDETNGVHARLAVDLAVAYTATGNRARATQVMEAARALTPGDNDVLFDLGAAYERAGQFQAAEASFREVISADPAHAGALNYLGYMLTEREQKLDEALALVERAVAIEPDNPSYLDSLGWVLFKLGRAAAAREPIARAAAARPQASLVQEHAGDIYLALKQYRAAADAFDRALQGDRQDIDVSAVTTKRDRARALAGG